MQKPNMLHEALRYLEKGVSVIPLWSPEEVKKNPQQYHDKLSEELEKTAKAKILLMRRNWKKRYI